ncbi:MAG: UDP-N-acetylmuramoyl-L-alanine--D-glutamate ligase [Spirochaetes bacterium]|nr:UDP-N-acetylmuramoyl-L-alanine--D-glutamate ligase [Spirochaetota bacterium]
MEQKKHILVVGLGYRTGLASANFLYNKGFAVTVCDIKSRDELMPIIQKLNPGITVIAGNQDKAILDAGFDEIVISPGVPQSIPLIQEAKAKGIPVISEIELAYRYGKSYIVGITGTDGKSTTTMLTAHCLKATGFDAHPCGNIGIPYVSIVDELAQGSVAVIELSSFQLETIHTFKPDVAIFTNLTPDHLDRYDSLEDYFNAKMNISKNQGSSDYFIVNSDDEFVITHLPPLQATQYSFSLQKEAECYYRDGAIYCTLNGKHQLIAKAEKFKILGLHNVQNAMAAILATLSIAKKANKEINLTQLEQALYSFEGLPHRVQMVGVFQGRSFINDSKATTVGAVIMALKSIPANVILILGGRAKGDDYSRLKNFFKGKVKALILIGETKDEFAKLFYDIPHIKAHTMEDAVIKAMGVSTQGDTILLSPACASFDMYKNYEERGNDFIDIFRRLSRGQLRWM